MKTSTIIIGIILFAIATMIIYGWGIIRQKNQTDDLMRMLFSKGESKVRKYLKKNDFITITDVEEMCENMQVKQPFSANRAVVKDKRDYAKTLLSYMVKKGQIAADGNRYVKNTKG